MKIEIETPYGSGRSNLSDTSCVWFDVGLNFKIHYRFFIHDFKQIIMYKINNSKQNLRTRFVQWPISINDISPFGHENFRYTQNDRNFDEFF